jgi:hypothetical protein
MSDVKSFLVGFSVVLFSIFICYFLGDIFCDSYNKEVYWVIKSAIGAMIAFIIMLITVVIGCISIITGDNIRKMWKRGVE